ncbi:phosphotransferase [Streptomyces sp. NPDC026672]|uniref:phosphotransferase n=1 Tax=unclassified Streptomyces TaxID=2593676 RepID=UPI0033C56A2C
MTADGEALPGGMVNAGSVFRRGALVERPAPRNARALHAHLRALGERGFDAAPVPVGRTADTRAAWSRDLADPEGGTMLCHNDVCPENVVFRDGRAAALIDFDMSAPGRPLWDVAMAARYWVPAIDPVSAAVLHPAGLDAPARLRVLADGYGLSAQDRAALPGVIEQATEVCRAFVAARVAQGDPVYLRSLAEHGGWERWDRIQTWLTARRETFTAALLT